MERRHLKLPGGTIAYRKGGDGPALVLVHGMASTSDTWLPVADMLAANATVVAIDLPGHGESTNPGGDYSLGAHASVIRDAMIALDIPRATFVGHSLGGGVVMQAAYQFPERCERLVLVDSGGLGREVAWFLRALALPGAELVLALGCSPQVLNGGRTVAGWLRSVGLRPTTALAEIAKCYANLERPAARTSLLYTLRSVVGAGGQRVSANERLALASHVPTLIVWGENDAIIPVSHGHAAHAAIPGSTLGIIPRSGHFPHATQPETFARTLLDFVGATEPASLSEAQIRALMNLA
jgi:pimeloyl-ACP methyl ester carboxylesterase